MHPAAKRIGHFSCDFFMFGLEPTFMLLWWGDVAAMRAGVAKVLDAHSEVVGIVRRGEATVDMCGHHAALAAHRSVTEGGSEGGGALVTGTCTRLWFRATALARSCCWLMIVLPYRASSKTA